MSSRYFLRQNEIVSACRVIDRNPRLYSFVQHPSFSGCAISIDVRLLFFSQGSPSVPAPWQPAVTVPATLVRSFSGYDLISPPLPLPSAYSGGKLAATSLTQVLVPNDSNHEIIVSVMKSAIS